MIIFDLKNSKINKKYEKEKLSFSSSCNCGSCNCNCGGGGRPTTKCSKQAKINMNTELKNIYKK